MFWIKPRPKQGAIKYGRLAEFLPGNPEFTGNLAYFDQY